MGKVRVRLARLDALRARIATVVPVDHLVVAGCRTGAATASPLRSAVTGLDLLHTPEIERRLIEACVAAGACDGSRDGASPRGQPGRRTHAAVVDCSAGVAFRYHGSGTLRRGTRS